MEECLLMNIFPTGCPHGQGGGGSAKCRQLQTGERGSKITKNVRTSFMDGPLTMKILQAHLVNHSWVDCLNVTISHLILWVMAGFLSMVLYNLFGMKGRRYLVKSKLKIIFEEKVRCWEVFYRTAGNWWKPNW